MQKKENKPKLVFVFPNYSSFIKNDIQILKKEYNVIPLHFKVKYKFLVPFYLFKQFVLILKYSRKSAFIISSFGGYHSFFPTIIGNMFKTPNFIMIHGTDATAIPIINYGKFLKRFQAYFLKKSYKNCTAILPVSESLIETNNLYEEKVGKQGLKHLVPNFNTPFTVIPNGCELDKWYNEKTEKRKNRGFVTVISGDSQFERKGADLIVKLAAKFKDCTFTIIGSNKVSLNTDNLNIIPFVQQEKLRQIFSQNRFYFQLSIFEGFGLALCEAMLCEMIPIGSNVNFIPEIIGDTGFVLEKRDEEKLYELIKNILKKENLKESEQKARQKIIKKFSLSNRSNLLLNYLRAFSNKEE